MNTLKHAVSISRSGRRAILWTQHWSVAVVMVLAVMGGPAIGADAPVDVPTQDAGFYMHLFEYAPPAGTTPQQVAVVGDFNKWLPSATPMVSDGAGHFVADVKLSEGAHSYQFFVDGQRVNDSAEHSVADLEESNTTRGHASAIYVGPDARNLPVPEPGKIAVDGLHHVQSNIRYFDPISAGAARLAVGTQAGDVSEVAIYTLVDTNWRKDALYPSETRKGITYFAGLVLNQTPNLSYFFELKDGSATGYYAGGKYFATLGDAQRNAWQGAMRPAFDIPEWAQHAVWYQIFPERFRNGETANDPQNVSKWTMRWAAPPATAPAATTGQARGGRGGRGGGGGGNRRYGGDIQGIQQQLPYLRSLGITCIYLNPIFMSPSVHKYDTSDYRHVDDGFGVVDPDQANLLAGETENPATWKWTKSDKLFLDFVAEAHRQGFKVVIDGVFNHSGLQFFAFQDVRQNGKNSKYADWIDVVNWDPFTYLSFNGRNGNMPELKKDPILGLTPGPREFVFNIARRWLAPDGDPSRGADGFRLDVAQNVPYVLWVDYRKVVKAVKPDAVVVGEVWSPASSYLRGDGWDATMHYPFANALQSFFVTKPGVTASAFAQRIQQFTMAYPFQIALNQWNLVGTHDTERWATRFVNSDRPAPAGGGGGRGRGDSSKPNDIQWNRMKQSVVVQMTGVGSPVVYYGDEVGMWGLTDPDDRQPMIWKDLAPYDDPDVTFKQDLFDHYVRLIALQRRLAPLHGGFAHTVLADDARNIVVYSRDLGDQHVYVLLNRSDTAQSLDVAIGRPDQDTAMIDWMDPSQAVVRAAPANAVDGRPQIAPVPAVAPAVVSHQGRATVNLKPWGAMILAPATTQ